MFNLFRHRHSTTHFVFNFTIECSIRKSHSFVLKCILLPPHLANYTHHWFTGLQCCLYGACKIILKLSVQNYTTQFYLYIKTTSCIAATRSSSRECVSTILLCSNVHNFCYWFRRVDSKVARVASKIIQVVFFARCCVLGMDCKSDAGSYWDLKANVECAVNSE